MINFDEYTNENKTGHNSKWPYIPDNPYRILIVGDFGSGKTNALLNLIGKQPDIDKIYLYAKVPYEEKYQYLIKKREKVGINHYDDPKAFMEYLNDMQDVYKNIKDYNPGKKRKVLTVFDDIIADMINDKKLNPLTYFPLRKAFEKQTKTNEDQGEKQIKAIQNKGPTKSIEKFTYDLNDSPLVLKKKEIYNMLTEKKL